jgi:hypothetical protein
MGIRGGIARDTLPNANKVRGWRIYADFAEALIKTARPLYAKEDLGLELNNTGCKKAPINRAFFVTIV